MMEGAVVPVPEDFERIVALVKREAAEESEPDRCLLYPALDACTHDAVAALWDSRIKTFVPLLALRRVRCCIRAGACDGDEW